MKASIARRDKKVVVVCGAGISSILDYPLQNNIWSFLKKKNSLEIEHLIAKMEGMYDDNIENTFTLLEMSNGDNSSFLRNISDHPGTTLLELKNVIAETFMNHKFKKAGEKVFSDFLAALGSLSNTTFVTLNWDLSLETLLAKKGFGSDYCVYFDSPVKGRSVVQKEIGKVPVVKMHGSINWRFCHGCKKFVCEDRVDSYNYDVPMWVHNIPTREQATNVRRFLQGLFFEHTGEGFKPHHTTFPYPVRRMRCSQCNGPWLETIITPPSLKKIVQIDPLNSVIRKTYQALQEADTLIFAGYSFREADYDLLYLLRDVTGPKDREVVIFENEEISARAERFFVSKNSPRYKNRVHKLGYVAPESVARFAVLLNT